MKKQNIEFRAVSGVEIGRVPDTRCGVGRSAVIVLMWLFLVGCTHRPAAESGTTAPAVKSDDSALPDKPELPPQSKVVVNALEARGAVAVEIVPQYNELLAGIEGELPLLIKLDGKEVANVARQPMDLAVVVDRSGSMSGDKIASVKVAALELLKRLIPTDRVTLISYADEVWVHSDRQLLGDDGVRLLRDEILKLTAGGGTALGPATLKAMEMLGVHRENEPDTDRPGGDAPNRLSHVLLLSDGIANVGVANPDALGQACAQGFQRGISVSTLGVGLDYNEDLMTRMADEGGGQYHYVREENRIATVLDDELKGLMATVARDIELEIVCAPGILVKEVYGYAGTPTPSGTRIRVGALRSGQNRDILVLLGYNAFLRKDEPVPVADVALRFRDMTRENGAEEISLSPRIRASGDEGAVMASENTEVTVRLAEVRSLEQLKTVAKAVNSGDFVQAEQVLVRSITTLEAQAKKTPDEKLTVQIQELQQARDELKVAKTSAAEQKHYVKKSKSTAYKKGKQAKGRKSTFEKVKAQKKNRASSKKPASRKKKTGTQDSLSF